MRIKEQLEGVTTVLEDIRKMNKTVPIIVEGKKDVAALRRLDFSGKIIRIKKRRSVFHIIEGLRGKHEEVIVMTDWDKTGGRLAYKIKKACEANEITCHMEYRKEIIKYVKKEVKDVEGLPKFIQRARLKVSRNHGIRVI